MPATSELPRAPTLVRHCSPFVLAGAFLASHSGGGDVSFGVAALHADLGAALDVIEPSAEPAGTSEPDLAEDAALIPEAPEASESESATAEGASEPAAADVSSEPDPAAASEEPEPEKKSFKLHSAQLPAMGGAQPWVSNTLWLDYFSENYNGRDNDDGFYAVVNYLNLGVDTRLRGKGFQLLSVSARLDSQTLPQGTDRLCDTNSDGEITPTDGECFYGNDFRLERFSLRLEHKHFKFYLGDFNVNFGRGLALSVRKKNDIGVDSTIKGVRLDLRAKNIEATGLWGVANRQQSDFATRQLFSDPGYKHVLCDDISIPTSDQYGAKLWTGCSDLIGGARVETKLPGKVRIAAHYGNIWFGQVNQISDQHEALHFVGGDVTRARLFKRWDVFWGTTAILRNYHHKEHHPTLVETGYGSYLSNNISLGSFNLLIEAKYYDNYVLARDMNPLTVQYTEATTLEREDQQIPAAANTAGPLIRLAYTVPKKGVTFYSNTLGYAYAYGNGHNIWDGEDALRLLHTYAGVDWDDYERGTSFKFHAGWRWEGYYQPQEGREQFERKLPHAEIYLNQALGHWWGFGHSVNFKWDWRRETVYKGDHAKHFHRGNVILGYGLAPYVTAAFIGGYSSEFPVTEGGIALHSQIGDDDPTSQRKPHLWPGGELRFNFLTSSFIRVFVGRQVGGLLCVNGSCRVLPDFSGARADLVLAF